VYYSEYFPLVFVFSACITDFIPIIFVCLAMHAICCVIKRHHVQHERRPPPVAFAVRSYNTALSVLTCQSTCNRTPPWSFVIIY
jgi:hypothetical protein